MDTELKERSKHYVVLLVLVRYSFVIIIILVGLFVLFQVQQFDGCRPLQSDRNSPDAPGTAKHKLNMTCSRIRTLQLGNRSRWCANGKTL